MKIVIKRDNNSQNQKNKTNILKSLFSRFFDNMMDLV